jgi:hypothetical protein
MLIACFAPSVLALQRASVVHRLTGVPGQVLSLASGVASLASVVIHHRKD